MTENFNCHYTRKINIGFLVQIRVKAFIIIIIIIIIYSMPHYYSNITRLLTMLIYYATYI